MAAKGKTYLAHAVGRRKCAVARVYLADGSGKVLVNKRELKEYFGKGTNRYVVNQPMTLMKVADKYDVKVNVRGGGTTGQAGAIRLGISRAILKVDPTSRPELKAAGFLTRDSRKVERKKAGMRGARARYQFSKR
jgi:small subunit ribosomal protein S9